MASKNESRPVADNTDTVGALLLCHARFGQTQGMVVVHKDEKSGSERIISGPGFVMGGSAGIWGGGVRLLIGQQVAQVIAAAIQNAADVDAAGVMKRKRDIWSGLLKNKQKELSNAQGRCIISTERKKTSEEVFSAHTVQPRKRRFENSFI